METQQGPRWIGLAEAADRYDVGTRTVGAGTVEYLAGLVITGLLDGRPADVPAEIRSDALDRLIELDLDSYLRRELDEDEASA
jgi:hypothetical protein